MGPYIVCLVTIDDFDKPRRVWVEHSLKKGLTACVNILPEIRSIYSWKGEICDDSERLMIMKTKRELFDALQTQIKALHPYEVPEIIALTIEDGFPPYLRWMDEVTQQRD